MWLFRGRNSYPEAEIGRVGLSLKAVSGGCRAGSGRLGFQRSKSRRIDPSPDLGGLHQRIFVESGKKTAFSPAQTPPPPDPDFMTAQRVWDPAV